MLSLASAQPATLPCGRCGAGDEHEAGARTSPASSGFIVTI
jgi:hypothetical protein